VAVGSLGGKAETCDRYARAASHGSRGGALLGAMLSAAVFLAVWALSRGGIGMADVKLAVLIGAAQGQPAAYSALVFGVISGAFVMMSLLVLGDVSRRQVTPYAPFLAVGAIVVVLLEGAAFAPR